MRGIIEMDLGSHELGQVDPVTRAALERALAGRAIDAAQARELIALPRDRLPLLLAVAGHVRTIRKGRTVTYSPKVFPSDHQPLPRPLRLLAPSARRQTNPARGRCCRKRCDARAAARGRPDASRPDVSRRQAERAFRSYRQTLAVLGRTTIEYVDVAVPSPGRKACCRILTRV